MILAPFGKYLLDVKSSVLSLVLSVAPLTVEGLSKSRLWITSGHCTTLQILVGFVFCSIQIIPQTMNASKSNTVRLSYVPPKL